MALDQAKLLASTDGYVVYLMGPSQYGIDSSTKGIQASVFAVPENYFDVVKNQYYVPGKVQEDLTGISELSNGDLNPIEMLYSNKNLNEYPE